ncbi:hypothetical protein LG284_16380 (plasmid) [Citricoccus nitrophenolicus]
MRTIPSPARTPAARRMARWRAPAMLPTIYRAERSKIGRPGHEGRAARTVLVLWGVGIVAGLVVGAIGVCAGRVELMVSGVVLTVVSIPLPIVNVIVVPGWTLWVDSEGKSAVVTSPRGNLSGFWSTNENALGLGLAVVVRMLRRRGRAGYKPRSSRHARAYAAGLTRIGATAKPKNESKPLGWWEVTHNEAAGRTLSNVVIGHPNGRRTIVMEGGAS